MQLCATNRAYNAGRCSAMKCSEGSDCGAQVARYLRLSVDNSALSDVQVLARARTAAGERSRQISVCRQAADPLPALTDVRPTMQVADISPSLTRVSCNTCSYQQRSCDSNHPQVVHALPLFPAMSTRPHKIYVKTWSYHVLKVHASGFSVVNHRYT